MSETVFSGDVFITDGTVSVAARKTVDINGVITYTSIASPLGFDWANVKEFQFTTATAPA